jgi:hypothetical protein
MPPYINELETQTGKIAVLQKIDNLCSHRLAIPYLNQIVNRQRPDTSNGHIPKGNLPQLTFFTYVLVLL